MAKKETKDKEQAKAKVSAEKVKETVEKAKETVGKAKETVEKTTEAASDKIKETAASIKETVSETVANVANKKPVTVKESCFIEFSGKQISVSEITAKAKKMFNGEIKTISVYVKPEDSKVYYVINDIEHGDFDI